MAIKIDSKNLDALENAWFSRSLETVRAGLFEVLFPALRAMEFCPVNNQVSDADTTFTYRWYEEFGQARLSMDYSSSGPRADIAGHEASSPIRALMDSYGYSFHEVKAAAKQNVPLTQAKANAARKAIAQKMDDILLLGDGSPAYLGLTGLFKLSGTNTATAPGTAWSSATGDQIVADLNRMVNANVSGTNGVEQPDTIILPLLAYQIANTKRIGDTNQTALGYFLATTPFVKTVTWSHKLNDAGSGGVARAMCYSRSPDKLEAIIPVEFEQMPPQDKDFESVTNCHARVGGVVCYFPKSVCYMDSDNLIT